MKPAEKSKGGMIGRWMAKISPGALYQWRSRRIKMLTFWVVGVKQYQRGVSLRSGILPVRIYGKQPITSLSKPRGGLRYDSTHLHPAAPG